MNDCVIKWLFVTQWHAYNYKECKEFKRSTEILK